MSKLIFQHILLIIDFRKPNNPSSRRKFMLQTDYSSSNVLIMKIIFSKNNKNIYRYNLID